MLQDFNFVGRTTAGKENSHSDINIGSNYMGKISQSFDEHDVGMLSYILLRNTVYVEILAGINFGDMAPNRSFKNIGGILI